MTDKFTPAMALAAASLLENRGLDVSKSLIAVVDQFNNSNIVSACQQKISANSAPVAVVNAISSLPYSLTGIVPKSMANAVAEDVKNQFYFKNLVLDVKKQTELLLSQKLPGLIQTLNEVNQFCVTSFYLKGYLDEIKAARFKDFGFTINNYKDEITGGINSQFSHLAGGISNESYSILFGQISNFGTLFDIKKLYGLSDPRVLSVNLIDQGFTKIQSYLRSFDIDVDNIENANADRVLLALKNVKGTDLKTILNVTQFVSYSSLDSLADVFDIAKILSPRAVVAAGGSLTALANKLVNIGGDFTSFEDLKTTYLSVADADLNYLNDFSDLTGNIAINPENEKLGYGSDIFSNPTVFDVIGCLSGDGYIAGIQALVNLQNKLSGTDIERDLLQAILNDDHAKITECKNLIANDAILKPLIAVANRNFRNVFKKLSIERNNLFIAGIDAAAATPANLATLYTFVVNLANSSSELKNIRFIEFVKSIIADDQYGEAVLAVIVEGANTNLLALKNIANYAQLDPISYSQSKTTAILNCIEFDPNDINDPNNPENPNNPLNPNNPNNPAVQDGTQDGEIVQEDYFIVTPGAAPDCATWRVMLAVESFEVTTPGFNLPDECVIFNVEYPSNDCFTVTTDHIYDYVPVYGKTESVECFTLSEYPGHVESTWTFDIFEGCEISPNQSTWTLTQPAPPVPAPGSFTFDADYALFSSSFSTGQDLELRVAVVSPSGLSTQYLGFGRSGSEGNPPWFTWGGDNTGTGAEAVLLDVAEFKRAFPAVSEIKIDYRVYWFAGNGGTVTPALTLWKGGSPIQANYTWTNPTATDVRSVLGSGKFIALKSTAISNGERLAVITYNLNTGAGRIDMDDNTNYGFNP